MSGADDEDTQGADDDEEAPEADDGPLEADGEGLPGTDEGELPPEADEGEEPPGAGERHLTRLFDPALTTFLISVPGGRIVPLASGGRI